ncbi:MAG: hypothetical protein ACI4SA_01775, partial [Lachnospiraceae bacterium]
LCLIGSILFFLHKFFQGLDIYVFCLLDCKEQEKIQPIDVTQWRFFILSTKALNEYSLTAKSISLSSLKKLPVVECDFYHIKESIDKMNI